MSLVFYYAPMSTASVTHLVLEELGVPYEKVRIDIVARDQDKGAFRALNPNGKVPVLVHDGTPIFESAAITIHLGEAFGVDKGLFPAPGLRRAEALKWIVWSNVSLVEANARYRRNTLESVPAERRNALVAEEARADVEAHLAILDRALEEQSWLVGDAFSLVDAHLGSVVGWVGMCGFDLQKTPRVQAWLGRVTARPAFKATMG